MNLAIGLMAQTACVWEATARKPGNVHRGRDFADLTYVDFLLSAAAIAPVLADAGHGRIGDTILRGVEATHQVVRTNTNLGILLLLAPLAAVPDGEELRAGVERTLAALDVADSRAVYRAIRLARPGGLGQVSEQDVRDEPTLPLREVMAFAADRDLISREYVNGFAQVFDEGVPSFAHGLERFGNLEESIIGLYLELLSRQPDTLIARKRGLAEAQATSRGAAAVLAAGWPQTDAGRRAIAEFDAWLRADGNTRNP